ncbi:MAG: SPOR domain-containing protein [Bacteroidales bacterium]|jgi:hypothetical protein|nr:SPOR domain-containing protein [Bacteroidales bacterium]
MDIVYNLKNFLADQQDEAAIPGLGVFFKSTADENGNALPEGESIILFLEKTPRSNAFVNYLGYEENLTENEATDILEQWVSSILTDLKTKKVAVIPTLGNFEVKDGKVSFIPAVDQNPAISSEYGMADLPAPSQMPRAEKPALFANETLKKWMPWIITAATVVVLVGASIACYQTIPQFRNWTDKTCENITKGISGKKSQPEPIIIASQDEVITYDAPPADEDFEENVTSPSKFASSETAKAPKEQAKKESAYRVIGGSFAIKTNAEKFHSKMKTEGYASEMIFDNAKQMYYVTLGSFNTMNKAVEFKDRIRKTKGMDCWIKN